MFQYWRTLFLRTLDRINPFCNKLAELWTKNPDLRFGQIISNLSRYAESNYGKDIFYLEEPELLKVLEEMLGGR